MRFNIAEFRSLLTIDKDNLDEELMRQASYLNEVSEAAAEASSIAEDLKEQLSAIDAEADREIRASGNNQYTEAHVKNKIILHPKHVSGLKAYLTAKAHAGKLRALKEAFVERGYLIRELCSLYVSNYYSTSSVRSETTGDKTYQRQRRKLAEERHKVAQEKTTTSDE